MSAEPGAVPRLMDFSPLAQKKTYFAVFIITMSTVMYELALTRIFSATTWYHFAFVAISVAMFGMSVGALLVYLHQEYFRQELLHQQLALSALFFGISMLATFLIYVRFPLPSGSSLSSALSLMAIYAMISIPFIFSGACICLALTRFPEQTSKMYAADLAGAALGCVLLIEVLNETDGPTAVVVIATIAITGSIFFSSVGRLSRLRSICILCAVVFLTLALVNAKLSKDQSPLIRLTQIRGQQARRPMYEKWNSFSRIQVFGNVTNPKQGAWLIIDSTASTHMLSLQSDANQLNFLKKMSSSTVHYLRPHSSVLVIGSGGGRDIVASLLFDQRSVLAVEMNQDILKTVNERYGDFTGHLDQDRRVKFVNDEARSYVARIRDRFDIIQVAFIDTFAATNAGAFTLTENSLYTIEAWKLLLMHLNPRGILTFTRFYFSQGLPAEAYRLTSLAAAALRSVGVSEPRENIVIVRKGWVTSPADNSATILLSRNAFSKEDLDAIEKLSTEVHFRIVLSPRFAADTTFAALSTGRVTDSDPVFAAMPLNISPPSDDKPFFFHMLRLRDVFKMKDISQGVLTFNVNAVFIVAVLTLVMFCLTAFCILIPLLRRTPGADLRGAFPISLFFCSIGFGFMLVEVSQMQRLIIFLGHPTYSLSVVLFALLLSGGAGSFITARLCTLPANFHKTAAVLLIVLLSALLIFGILTPYAIQSFQGAPTFGRIGIAAGILIPIGLFMGMAFPLGMRVAAARFDRLTAWLWGINGATSVCASVLATVISLSFGISASFWTGVTFYAIALVAFLRSAAPRVQVV